MHRIKLTRHARQRALERDIGTKDIEFVLNNPVETTYDSERENYKSFALVNHPFTKELSYLMIVHSKFNTQVTVISAMWQTRGGLRKNGFNKVR